MTARNTQARNQTQAPPQEDVNATMLAGLQHLAQRLDALSAPPPAATAEPSIADLTAFVRALTQAQALAQQPVVQPAVNGPLGVLAATLGKNGKPLKVKREDILFGTHPHTDDIIAAARHAADADLAYEYGICQEPDREGLSPWAIAGIAVGAAALGAGVAVGINAYMNSDAE